MAVSPVAPPVMRLGVAQDSQPLVLLLAAVELPVLPWLVRYPVVPSRRTSGPQMMRELLVVSSLVV